MSAVDTVIPSRSDLDLRPAKAMAVVEVHAFRRFTYPNDPETKDIAFEAIAFSDEMIQREDIRICENVRKGLASRSDDQCAFGSNASMACIIFTACLRSS
jgi:hypothetical protein